MSGAARSWRSREPAGRGPWVPPPARSAPADNMPSLGQRVAEMEALASLLPDSDLSLPEVSGSDGNGRQLTNSRHADFRPTRSRRKPSKTAPGQRPRRPGLAEARRRPGLFRDAPPPPRHQVAVRRQSSTSDVAEPPPPRHQVAVRRESSTSDVAEPPPPRNQVAVRWQSSASDLGEPLPPRHQVAVRRQSSASDLAEPPPSATVPQAGCQPTAWLAGPVAASPATLPQGSVAHRPPPTARLADPAGPMAAGTAAAPDQVQLQCRVAVPGSVGMAPEPSATPPDTTGTLQQVLDKFMWAKEQASAAANLMSNLREVVERMDQDGSEERAQAVLVGAAATTAPLTAATASSLMTGSSLAVPSLADRQRSPAGSVTSSESASVLPDESRSQLAGSRPSHCTDGRQESEAGLNSVSQVLLPTAAPDPVQLRHVEELQWQFQQQQKRLRRLEHTNYVLTLAVDGQDKTIRTITNELEDTKAALLQEISQQLPPPRAGLSTHVPASAADTGTDVRPHRVDAVQPCTEPGPPGAGPGGTAPTPCAAHSPGHSSGHFSAHSSARRLGKPSRDVQEQHVEPPGLEPAPEQEQEQELGLGLDGARRSDDDGHSDRARPPAQSGRSLGPAASSALPSTPQPVSHSLGRPRPELGHESDLGQGQKLDHAPEPGHRSEAGHEWNQREVRRLTAALEVKERELAIARMQGLSCSDEHPDAHQVTSTPIGNAYFIGQSAGDGQSRLRRQSDGTTGGVGHGCARFTDPLRHQVAPAGGDVPRRHSFTAPPPRAWQDWQPPRDGVRAQRSLLADFERETAQPTAPKSDDSAIDFERQCDSLQRAVDEGKAKIRHLENEVFEIKCAKIRSSNPDTSFLCGNGAAGAASGGSLAAGTDDLFPSIVRLTEVKLQQAYQYLVTEKQRTKQLTKHAGDTAHRLQQLTVGAEALKQQLTRSVEERQTLQTQLTTAEASAAELRLRLLETREQLQHKEELLSQATQHLEDRISQVAELSRQLEATRSDTAQNERLASDRLSEQLDRCSQLENAMAGQQQELKRLQAVQQEANQLSSSEQRLRQRVLELQERLDQSTNTARMLENYILFLKSSYNEMFGPPSATSPPLASFDGQGSVRSVLQQSVGKPFK